jgi:hypothetical protein
VDEPPSPSTGKSPPGPEDTDDPVGAKGVPTSPSDASLGHDAAHQFPRPEPTEHPKVSPQSPKSFGLRAPSGRQPSEAEWEQIKAMYSSMKITYELIDVSIFTSP